MFKMAYTVVGVTLIGGYLTWSFLGKQVLAPRKDKAPVSSSGSGRGRSTYFGGGFHWGK